MKSCGSGLLGVSWDEKLSSSTDGTVQCFLDEPEAALVQKRVLPLWLADAEMIHVHLDQVPDADIWNHNKAAQGEEGSSDEKPCV